MDALSLFLAIAPTLFKVHADLLPCVPPTCTKCAIEQQTTAVESLREFVHKTISIVDINRSLDHQLCNASCCNLFSPSRPTIYKIINIHE